MEEKKFDKEYLTDTYKFELETKIRKFEINEKDSKIINLYCQNTIFHPQGGGQPSDEGEIIFQQNNNDDDSENQTSNDNKLKVIGLEYNRGLEVVVHKLDREAFEKLQIKEGQTVQMKINEEKRKIYARLHSGGHLLDVAVNEMKLNWQPGKGYHFEKGPYVEYFGELEADKVEETIQKLNEICKRLIAETDSPAEVKLYSYSEAEKIMKIPDYIPFGVDFRYVKLFRGDEGCPCGGTHVQKVQEIQNVIITKIKINAKKRTITVSYSVDPVEIKQKQEVSSNNKKKEKSNNNKNSNNNNDVNGSKKQKNNGNKNNNEKKQNQQRQQQQENGNGNEKNQKETAPQQEQEKQSQN